MVLKRLIRTLLFLSLFVWDFSIHNESNAKLKALKIPIGSRGRRWVYFTSGWDKNGQSQKNLSIGIGWVRKCKLQLVA